MGGVVIPAGSSARLACSVLIRPFFQLGSLCVVQCLFLLGRCFAVRFVVTLFEAWRSINGFKLAADPCNFGKSLFAVRSVPSRLIGHFPSPDGMWVASRTAWLPIVPQAQQNNAPRPALFVPLIYFHIPTPRAYFPSHCFLLLHRSFIVYSLESVFLSRINNQSLLRHIFTLVQKINSKIAIMQYSKLALLAAVAAPLASAQGGLAGLPTCAVCSCMNRMVSKSDVLMFFSTGNCSHLFAGKHRLPTHRLRLYLQEHRLPDVSPTAGSSCLQPQRLGWYVQLFNLPHSIQVPNIAILKPLSSSPPTSAPALASPSPSLLRLQPPP